MFAILTLLGFDYRPVLADLPDAKLWRIDPGADYGPLDKTARGRIDLGKITRHWPDILRVIASIHTREISAHDVIRMLQRDGRPTQLGEAFAALRADLQDPARAALTAIPTTGAPSRACETCRKAATTWPGTSSTAAEANCTRPTEPGWRTSSAPWAWC